MLFDGTVEGYNPLNAESKGSAYYYISSKICINYCAFTTSYYSVTTQWSARDGVFGPSHLLL
jgi:hypothetical protein